MAWGNSPENKNSQLENWLENPLHGLYICLMVYGIAVVVAAPFSPNLNQWLGTFALTSAFISLISFGIDMFRKHGIMDITDGLKYWLLLSAFAVAAIKLLSLS